MITSNDEELDLPYLKMKKNDDLGELKNQGSDEALQSGIKSISIVNLQKPE